MEEYAHIEDIELIRRMRGGDRHAYRILFDRYYIDLCKQAAYRLNGDEDSAQDVVQQVFIDFWVQKKYESVSTDVKGYLAGMMRFKAVDHVRDEVRKRENRDKWLGQTNYGQIDESDDPAGNHTELLKALRHEIEQLPPQCKAVFVSAYLEEKTYDQVAEQMGISRNSVKTQMKIAMKKLRERLKDHLPRLLPLLLFTLITLLKRL